MDLRMGSQVFLDVEIPLLWGTRAVVQDKKRRLSVIDLSGSTAVAEIIGDRPAPGVQFVPAVGGFKILRDGRALYMFNSADKTLTAINLNLPECQITPWGIRVGTNIFQGNLVIGLNVGITVAEDGGVSLGSPLPNNLAKLAV